ncbi:unnamed protein product [Aureobasidium uvarum]|uniref:AMMECR1 domain-containing protein n=1 Tax=Aureobasidium uvarum TaxID=2773716 RepID=A0A9N8KEG2_9PEZI|nr:unnamed protein product [Aureobasidium uvarum]
MATKAHCAYCFESLVASFEGRQPLSLSQVEQLWTEQPGREEEDAATNLDGEDDETEPNTSRVPAISRLLNSDTPTSNSSSSSLTSRSTSTQASTSSSRTSLSSRSNISPSDSYPLFVTWNTISPRSGQKSLRGCIGTFAPQLLEKGLADYALTSAFEDSRFPPIASSQLPQLQCCVTLLTNFSNPSRDIMAWEVGKHGIRISFSYHGRKLGATYLPDVAREQGWTKEEALVSLMRKAGWSGRKDEWRKVASSMELVTYEGKKVDLEYAEFKEWSDKVKA